MFWRYRYWSYFELRECWEELELFIAVETNDKTYRRKVLREAVVEDARLANKFDPPALGPITNALLLSKASGLRGVSRV